MYSLVGVDGNAFSVMGYTAKAMRICGMKDKVEEMRADAMSGDYNNLLCVCMSWIDKCNEYLESKGVFNNEDEG